MSQQRRADGPADRVAKVRLRAEAALSGARTAPTTAQVLDATAASIADALGTDAPMPSSWTATRNREEVERMSRLEMPVRQIAAALGISYSYVVQLRGQIGVGKSRRRATASRLYERALKTASVGG